MRLQSASTAISTQLFELCVTLRAKIEMGNAQEVSSVFEIASEVFEVILIAIWRDITTSRRAQAGVPRGGGLEVQGVVIDS
jgi:hypothetical protein